MKKHAPIPYWCQTVSVTPHRRALSVSPAAENPSLGRSNFCQNEVTVTASADVPTLTGACLGVVYNISTGKSDGINFLRARFDVQKVRYFLKRRPHNTTVSASRWVCGEGLWGFGRLTVDHVLPLHRSRPTRSRPWASWAPYGLKSSYRACFQLPVESRHAAYWSYQACSVDSQYCRLHICCTAILIWACHIPTTCHTGVSCALETPGPGHVQRLKRPAERARLAACANRPACRTRAGKDIPGDPPDARRRHAQPERHPKRCGPRRGLSAAPPQSPIAAARPTRLRLAVSATCRAKIQKQK